MSGILTLLTPPAGEPITIEDAKLHAHVDGDAEDMLIGSLIATARQIFEFETGRHTVPTEWQLALDAFPSSAGEIKLPGAPLLSVASIIYFDADGSLVTLDSYEYEVIAGVGPYAAPGIVIPTAAAWPSTYSRRNAVTVRYSVGYEEVPDAILQAIRQIVADLYLNRESSTRGSQSRNAAYADMVNAFRIPVFA